MRTLFFCRTNCNIFLIAKHAHLRVDNVAADTLSRDNLPSFVAQAASPVPQELTGISGAAPGLDTTELDKIAGSLFAKGLAESSQRTYRCGQNRRFVH